MCYESFKKEIDKWRATEEIGGRSTDITQVAYSLYNEIKSFFPMNEVPQNLQTQINDLTMVARKFEYDLDKLLHSLIKEVEREKAEFEFKNYGGK